MKHVVIDFGEIPISFDLEVNLKLSDLHYSRYTLRFIDVFPSSMSIVYYNCTAVDTRGASRPLLLRAKKYGTSVSLNLETKLDGTMNLAIGGVSVSREIPISTDPFAVFPLCAEDYLIVTRGGVTSAIPIDELPVLMPFEDESFERECEVRCGDRRMQLKLIN
jgi:hypothetical protein